MVFTHTVFNQTDLALVDQMLPLPSLAVAFADPKWQPTDEKPTVTTARQAGSWFFFWALYADQGAHRAGFWNFVNATTRRPLVDDALVQRHLGINFSELDDQVGKFRRENQAKVNLRIKLPLGATPPTPAIRDATDAEIGRMLAQWALIAWRQNPQLAGPLREAARRLLTRALQQSGGDAELTALLGLVELQAGNSDDARKLLESVADSADLNPRARLELAKLRYFQAVTETSASKAKFDAKQTAAILTPLIPFIGQPPGDSLPLALISQTWLRAAIPPPREDLINFVNSARQFPRDHQLMMQTALLCFQQQLDQEADELISAGLATVADSSIRGALQELRQRIAARAPN